jgi:UrcA family protein
MSLARVIGSFSAPFTGGSAMTRSTGIFVLHRALERVSAGAAAIALTFFALVSVDARAADTQPPASVRVVYSELAFDTPAGAAEVYVKLKHAARKVCDIYTGARTLQTQITVNKCIDAAVANAVLKIDRARLSALHASDASNLG